MGIRLLDEIKLFQTTFTDLRELFFTVSSLQLNLVHLIYCYQIVSKQEKLGMDVC